MPDKLSFAKFNSYKIFNIISTRAWESINPFIGYNAISRIAKGLQIPEQENEILKRIIFAEQVHGKNVHICQTSDGGSIRLGVDGLISNGTDHILAIYSADCIPLLLFDPKNKVVGAIHAGYKGLSQGIITNCLREFQNNFNSQMSNIIIGIGPFIHVCCYEVKEDIFDFIEKLGWMKFLVKRNERFFLDLTSIVYQQLMINGILKSNIENINLCTSSRKDLLFSARQRTSEEETGSSIVSLISLTKNF